jgi:hypothetical protein
MRDGTRGGISGYDMLDKVELLREGLTVAVIVGVSSVGEEDRDAVAHWVASGTVNHESLGFRCLGIDNATRRQVNIHAPPTRSAHSLLGIGYRPGGGVQSMRRRERSGTIHREFGEVNLEVCL